MDPDQPPTTQSGEMVLAKFETLPNEENMEMEVGQHMEEQVLGYLEVQPSQLQAVQEGGTIYFQSDGLELDEQLILAQGGEGGEIIVVVRTDQDGMSFTGEGGESALRAVKFGDLAGLAQQMGLAPGTKIALQSDDKDDESGTTYLTYETTGEDYTHQMQETLHTTDMGIPGSEGSETITLSLSDNTVSVLSVGDETLSKNTYLQEHGEMTEIPVSVAEDGTLTPLRIIEKPSDGTNSEDSNTIMHIVDNVSQETAREDPDQCFIAVGVNGEEINNVESYNAALAQVVEQERRINSPSKHPIVVRLPSAAEMAKDTNTSAQSDSQVTSEELPQQEQTGQLVTSNGENQLYQTTIVTNESGQQQVEYHLVQASDITDDGEPVIQPAISESDCYGQWSAMDTAGQSLINEQPKCEENATNVVNDISDSAKTSSESNQDVFVPKSSTESVHHEDPPVNETLRSIEEFLRTGETGDSDDEPPKVDSKPLVLEKKEKKKTESKEDQSTLPIVETQLEESVPTDTVENNEETIQHMVMEELGETTTSYVVIDIDNAPEFASAIGNNIQMESVNFKSVVNEHGQSVGILETANGDLEVILDSESLVPSTNASFTKVNHDDEMSAISNHTSAVNEAIAPQLQKTFQKLLSTPEKRPQASLESAPYQLHVSSTKSKVNSKSQLDGEFSKRGSGFEKPSRLQKESAKEKKATIFDVGASTEDFKVKIPTRQYSRTYSRKKTTPPPITPSTSTSKETPQMTLAGNEFSRNDIILVIEPNEEVAREYERIDLSKSDISHHIDPSKMEIVIESVNPSKDEKVIYESKICDSKETENVLEKESDLPKPIVNDTKVTAEEKEGIDNETVMEILKNPAANETQKDLDTAVDDGSLTISISEDMKENNLVQTEELQAVEEESSLLTKETSPESHETMMDSTPHSLETTKESLIVTNEELTPELKISTQDNEEISQDSLTNKTTEKAPCMKPIMSTPLETVVEDPGEIMELQEPSKAEEIPDDIFNGPNDATILPEDSLTLTQHIIDEPKEIVSDDHEKIAFISEDPGNETQKTTTEQEDSVDVSLGVVVGSPQESGSLPEEDVFTPLEPVAIPDEDIPIPCHLSEPIEVDKISSTPKEPSAAVREKESLEKEFIAIAKKSVAVAKKSLPVPIAKKSVAVRKTRARKNNSSKDLMDVSNEESENDKVMSEIERMESEIENDIQDSLLSGEKSISADEEHSQFGLDQDESMNYDDDIMKGSVVLDDSQLDSIKISTKDMGEKRSRKSRKRQSDSEIEKETKRAKSSEPRQKASTSESVTITTEKIIKRKLFTAGSKKLGRPKKSSTGGKAYQSQDELFDELLKDSLPGTVKRRKDAKTKNSSTDSKRRRTLPARLPNNYASSDEDDVVLSNLFQYPEKKFKSMGQGKRGRGRKPKVFQNRGSSDEEEVMMSNLRIYPETFNEPSSKKGRGRGKVNKTGSSSSYAKFQLENQGRLTKSDPSKRGRGRPRGSTFIRRKPNMGHRSFVKKQKECKIHYCYQQSSTEKSHQIYTCKECHFRTSRMANIIRHYKDCSLDMFPFKSNSLAERTPIRFKLDAASGSKSLPDNRIFRRLETPKKTSTTKSDKSSSKARRPDDPNASRDENSIGTDDQEVSDSTLDSDEEDSYDIEMKNTFGFAENDVVWAEWRNQHWPALVRKIYPRQKKVSIFFIATPMPSKGFSMHVRKITNFDDAAKNKDFLEKGFSLQSNNEQLVKAVQLAEDYLRKKCLGLKMSALQFFNDPEAAKQILSELEESAENPASDHSDSHLNDPLTPIAIIDLDRLTNPAGEEMGDGEGVDDRSKTEEEDEAEAAKMVKFIMDGNADEHLIQVYKEDVKSERHRLFNSSLDSDRDCVKRASIYKGAIKDEIKKVELTQYCMDLFKKKLTPAANFDVVAYAYEVMATEAILKAISLLSDVTLKEAEEIFVKDDVDKTQCIFAANNKTVGSVVFEDSAKVPVTVTGEENDDIAEPESRETCPISQTELPT